MIKTAEIKWIKLATNIFDNRKIRMIESMPDGASIVLIWLKLLCLAGNINDSGMVYFTTDIPYTDQMMATQFNMPLTTVQVALKTFEQFGMIESVDSILHVANWEKYQNIEGMEKVREQTRKRVADYRERQKLLQPVTQCNATVTQCNATDIDKEEDKERRKKNKNNKYKDPFDVYKEENPELFQALKEFESMRKAIKKPMTDRSKSMLLSKLAEFAEDQWIPVLYQSIDHCWASVYELKGSAHGKHRMPDPVDNNASFDLEALKKIGERI